MKNKRKYENSAPATADEISKKSLKKLKKLTKPENPLAKVRYNCVQEIESGDWRVERLERKKSNIESTICVLWPLGTVFFSL